MANTTACVFFHLCWFCRGDDGGAIGKEYSDNGKDGAAEVVDSVGGEVDATERFSNPKGN